MEGLYQTKRVSALKEKILSVPRYASIEQARIITRVYKENEHLSVAKKRALSLQVTLENLEIDIKEEELIVGNRTNGVRYGVVFPESGCSCLFRSGDRQRRARAGPESPRCRPYFWEDRTESGRFRIACRVQAPD